MSEDIYINKLGIDLSELFEEGENEIPTLESNPRRRKTGPVEQRKRKKELEPEPEPDDENVDDENQEEPKASDQEEELTEEELQKIEAERKKCVRAINKYRIRVPHLLQGHTLKEMSVYQQMSLKELQDELEIINMTTRANINTKIGRSAHNVLWQGIEYAGVKMKRKVVGIADIVDLDEVPKSLKDQMGDIVDLLDIEYGPDSPNLFFLYLMTSVRFFTAYEKQNIQAEEARGETGVAMSEASKLIPMDLQREAESLLN